MRSQSPAPSVLISTKFKALQHHDIMRQLIVDSQTDKTSPTRCVALVWKGLRLACNIGASKCSSARLKAGNNFRNDSAKARFVPMTTFSLIFLAVDCATACEASTCRTIRVTTLACASPCCGTSPRQRHENTSNKQRTYTLQPNLSSNETTASMLRDIATTAPLEHINETNDRHT